MKRLLRLPESLSTGLPRCLVLSLGLAVALIAAVWLAPFAAWLLDQAGAGYAWAFNGFMSVLPNLPFRANLSIVIFGYGLMASVVCLNTKRDYDQAPPMPKDQRRKLWRLWLSGTVIVCVGYLNMQPPPQSGWSALMLTLELVIATFCIPVMCAFVGFVVASAMGEENQPDADNTTDPDTPDP